MDCKPYENSLVMILHKTEKDGCTYFHRQAGKITTVTEDEITFFPFGHGKVQIPVGMVVEIERLKQ